MDYAGMAQRLGQFRQAQVPGGGQRPMNGWGGGPRGGGMGSGIVQGLGNRIQGMLPQQAQGAFGGAMNRAQGMMPQQRPQGMAGWFGSDPASQQPILPPMGQFRGRGGMGGGGSFGGGGM
jgi:hypothetical protein